MFHFLLYLFTLISQAEMHLQLPVEILTVLQEEYPGDAPPKPVPEEMEILFKGEKNSQGVKVGFTKDTLDLAPHVDKAAASFEIEFKLPFEMNENTKLFFINRYRPSANQGDKGGMACGKALKIQSKLNKLFTTQGVKFMTKDASYLNLLGGDFLITHLDDHQQLHVVYFKIIDSRYGSRRCS